MSYFEDSCNQFLKEYQGSNPGAAISIIKNGKTYNKCYGIANMETNTPVNSSTNFRLASMTKPFTSMCIMILAQKGKLSIDDTLRDIIPEFPSYADNITIRDMLHHTSGIARSILTENYIGQLRERDVLKIYLNLTSTDYEPRTKMQYSNDAYVLLGIIIERVSELSFSEFMEREIFKKLGMNSSVLHNVGVTQVKNRAYGYTRYGDNFGFCDQSQTSLLLGDGGVYSSLNDLYKWEQTLYSESLVSMEILEMALTSGVLNNGEKIGYGFGWYLDEWHGYDLVFHGGASIGFKNMHLRVPDLQYSIILLTNRNELDWNFPVGTEDKDKNRYMLDLFGSDLF